MSTQLSTLITEQLAADRRRQLLDEAAAERFAKAARAVRRDCVPDQPCRGGLRRFAARLLPGSA